MTYFLGIDLGTSSVKVILVSHSGKIVARYSKGYAIYSPFTGWAEQDPEEWWQAVTRAIRGVLAQARIDSSLIKGIGISGQTHGTVVLDKNHHPLRKAIIWMDRRSVPQVERLKKESGKRIMSITGLPISCGFMLPSVLWIKENEPEIWDKIFKIILPKDYIRLKLTGEVASDVSDAGGTLLLDVVRRTWSKEIADETGISFSFFPPLFESSQLTGYVIEESANKTGLKKNTPVFAGGADQVMMAIGSGVVDQGDVASSIGTGALLIAYLTHPILKPDRVLHTIPYAIPERWIIMGAILSGGASLSWFINRILGINLLEKKLDEFISQELSSRSAASRGLIFLPYLDGERTPHLDPLARGSLIGLTLNHDQRDLIRAVMEGVIFALRDCLEEFKKSGIKPSRLVATGGGAKSKIWRQIQANIFNLPVAVPNTEEASAYGASVIAAVGSGFFSSTEEACKRWIKKEVVALPNCQEVKIYSEVYQIYRQLYSKLRKDFHFLSRIEQDVKIH